MSGVPRLVLVPELPEDAGDYEALLAGRRGGPVTLRCPCGAGSERSWRPRRATPRRTSRTHRLRRASDYDSRARAIESLRVALGMEKAPLRIECYDMSHLQGTDYVGSMVVLEDGLAKKSEYRHFRVREVPGNDDYAAMEEVLTRRLSALVEERSQGPSGKPRRFAYPPQLLLLDGGKGQLSVGVRVLGRLGLSDEIAVAALAKQFEEVFVPGTTALRIPRGSEALFLLQRVRDEAHRFAVSYHRRLRGRRMSGSTLEGVPGLGPARRARLLRAFGSVRALREASYEDLESLGWLPERVAAALYEHLHRRAGAGSAASGAGARRWQRRETAGVVPGEDGT